MPFFRRPHRTWPTRLPVLRGCGIRGSGVVLGLLLLVGSGCSDPVFRKRTFVGQSGERTTAPLPVGLNPVGALDTCLPGVAPVPLGMRILISRPELFSRRSSQIVAALREALALDAGGRRVTLLLSARPLLSAERATEEGRRCGAMLVLWERERRLSLEMSLPQPARIPLRHSVPERLCAYGNDAEQANILYFTILSLAATLDRDYDQALFLLTLAARIDEGCLRLPLAGVRDLPEHEEQAPTEQPQERQ